MMEIMEQPAARAYEPDRRTVTGICGICPGGCGVEIELAGGRIERLKPLKGHPRGIVCTRGSRAKEIVYSPDRLEYPMMRTGRKGEGRFKRIGWDEALDKIAGQLLEIKRAAGAEAVMTYLGRGLFDSSLIEPFAPPGINTYTTKSLIFPFGSPNTAGCGSLCYTSYGTLAAISTFGQVMGDTYPDFDNSNLILVWGANPATDSPPTMMKQILEAKKRGARVIVIDRMRTHIAAAAHHWISIRSGTDGALALGMINVIIEEDLYDKAFVEQWSVGFDDLREYAREFPPEEVERITGVPRQVVLDTARMIAAAKPAALSMYTGLEYTDSGVQNLRAVYILYALTGNLDVPGGIVFRSKGKQPYNRTDIPPPSHPKPIGHDKYPLFCDLTQSAQFMEAPRAILHGDPYPIKALIVAGASILTGYPNPDIWKACLEKLELLVVIDRFLTADAMYADLVLPATTYFENYSYEKSPGFIQLRQRIIEPVGEARCDLSIFAGLAQRLGYGHLFPRNEEELLATVLKDHPVSLEELRRHPEGVHFGDPGEKEFRKYEQGLLREDRQPGFGTPSGKVEFASSLLAEYGFDPLPVYTEPSEGPLANRELASQYPLILNTGARIQSTFRSQHLNIPGLLQLQPEPQVLIHTQDARARGIANGDRVTVETLRGSVPFTAKVTGDVRLGEVEVNAGGGGPIQAKAWREANVNYLTDVDNRDPISGFPVFKALLCEVRMAGNI